MSMIICPECKERVSSLAGTCPHCGIAIRGMIRQCPYCNTYVMKNAERCDTCKNILQPITENSDQDSPSVTTDNQQRKKQNPKKKKKGLGIVKGLLGLLCFVAAATGSYYYFHQQQEREREEKLYAQLDTLTDPKFFQQFLVDFPESSHCEEVKQRMKSLVKENQDWESVLSSISHSSITLFLEQYPQSHRRYLCENMLDSIDWAKAVQEETPEAIDTYLSLHPEGEHVTEAANIKNQLAMTKITPEDKMMMRGALDNFLNNGLSKQDTTAIRLCIADDFQSFCHIQHATPAQIVTCTDKKMEKDVIGLHYQIGPDMNVRRQSLPDSAIGYAIQFSIEETMVRKDPTLNTNHHYRASALLNQEHKILKFTIR
ncbi:MAG: zinc ribbon domain-containing protein [Bacteroidaceae bacterium]|nr:zinc ribbon domain-containing protein [Bacteroidaceae bacterium]